MTLTTPAGRPASSNSWATIAQQVGENSEGFQIALFPAAMMWASAIEEMSVGKLYGVIAPTTPTGRWVITSRLLLVCSWVDGNESPRWRRISAPALSYEGAAYS